MAVANHEHGYNTEPSQRHTYARTAEAFDRTSLAFSCDLGRTESQREAYAICFG
jgi:hypothetical protein